MHSNAKSPISLALLLALCLASCSPTKIDQPLALKVEKPFVSAGKVDLQLDGGDYIIRAAAEERIRVSFGGNTDAAAGLTTHGSQANLSIRNTPHNFRAAIEVPKAADLTVHLTGGNLEIAAITGNKEIDSQAGNVQISVPDPNDYGNVDASVKVGNLNAGPFGQSTSGLSPHVKWSGPGKYELRVNLGAGNLDLKR